MLVYHIASEDDMFNILKLYTEFNQGEPCAQALGLTSYPNPSIAVSLSKLAQAGKIMLCSEKESMVVVGMGVFYKQKCEVWPSEDIELVSNIYNKIYLYQC